MVKKLLHTRYRVSDLEKTEIVRQLLDSLPHDNPLARDKGDLYSDTNNLISLFATMKRENWDVRRPRKNSWWVQNQWAIRWNQTACSPG